MGVSGISARRVICGVIAGAGVIGITGCVSRTSQPMVYPVIVPVYSSPSSYNQATQPYPITPVSPVSQVQYPKATIYNQVGGEAVAVPDRANQQPQQLVSPTMTPVTNMGVQGQEMGAMSPGLPHMTTPQRLQMAEALFRYSEGQVEPIANDLAAVMQPVLEASACGMAWVPSFASQYAEAERAKALAPFASTPKHGQSTCLDVYQVDNWRISPPRRLAFRVLFQSPKTNERASRRFEMVREATGWHFLTMNEPF